MTDLIEKDKNDTKISVIVPVYQVEQYLGRCIDSIISQTYKNLEIILVDDGSNDSCPEICDKYSLIDKRIKVIHKVNGGLSSARNAGLKVATGEYISLVDSDDYINCNMYSDLLNELLSEDADIAMCDCKYVYDTDEDADTTERALNLKIKCEDGRSIQYYSYKDDHSRIVFNVAWNKLYKKKLFDDVSFPEGRIHEDEAITHQILYRASKVVYVQYPYYFYFQRKDSIVGKRISRQNLQLIDAYIDKLRFYRTNKEYDLWCMEASHAMHMLCYQQLLFKTNNMEVNISKESQGVCLMEELGNVSTIQGISFLQRMEIFLFTYLPDLYKMIWKQKKG